MIDEGAPPPAVILGFPVGFVGAAESKQALIEAENGVPLSPCGTARRQRARSGSRQRTCRTSRGIIGDDGEMALDHRYRRRWPRRPNPAARAIVDNAEVSSAAHAISPWYRKMGVNGSLGQARSHVAARNRKTTWPSRLRARDRRSAATASARRSCAASIWTKLRSSPAARPLRWPRHGSAGRATRSSVYCMAAPFRSLTLMCSRVRNYLS